MPKAAKKRVAGKRGAKAQPKPTLGQVAAKGIVGALVFTAFYFLFGIALTAVSYLLYSTGVIGYNDFTFLGNALGLLSLSIAVFAYFVFYKRVSLGKVPNILGFISNNLPRNIGIGVIIFLMILILELVVALIGQLTNVTINTNVQTALAGAPFWYYVFAAVIEPINEEIMFRGFLVPRIGIIPSALIFGALHYTYYSTFGIEVIAATVMGLLAGYAFKKTGSIYPGMVAHIIINTIGVIGAMG